MAAVLAFRSGLSSISSSVSQRTRSIRGTLEHDRPLAGPWIRRISGGRELDDSRMFVDRLLGTAVSGLTPRDGLKL